MSYPAPILNLNFANAKQLIHPAVSFSRASPGSLRDSNGVMRYVAAGVPRYDHDPLTGICKGLLIEPQVTFFDVIGEQYDHPSWIKSGTATVTPNTSLGLTGESTADTLNFPAGLDRLSRQITVAGGQTLLFSVPLSGSGTINLTLISTGGVSKRATKSITLTGVLTLYYITLDLGADNTGCWLVIGRYDNYGAAVGTATSVVAGECKVCIGSTASSTIPTSWETTSNTSNDIGTGSKTFAVGNNSFVPGKAIPAGASVRAWQTTNAANYMTGTVTSHSGTSLVLNITASGGSGTGIANWTIQAGASTTRAADIGTTDLTILRDGSGASVWSGTGGTLVVQGRTAAGKPGGTAVQVLAQIDDGTANNRVRIYRNSTGNVRCSADAGGANQADLDLGVVADSTEFKVVFSFAANAFYASINGGTSVSDTSGTMPTGLVTRRHGCDSAGASQWGGHLKLDQTYNRQVSSADLPALSAL